MTERTLPEAGLKTIASFVRPNPPPLSTLPSGLLRQALADACWVAERGAVLDMMEYGEWDPQADICTVCFAGALLLARGYYTKPYIPSGCETSADPGLPLYISPKDDMFLWYDDDYLDRIVTALNLARQGNFEGLLNYGNVAKDDPIRHEITCFKHIYYETELDDRDIREMCEELEAVATFLEERNL